ncbi:hypothetical protein PG988_011360 [Apiospora saccharicola]
MESVAALGVAAAAVQFFGVVVKATALCREIRDNAESATDHNRDLEVSVRELRSVQAQLAHATQSSQTITRRRITDCLTKCYVDYDELLRLLEEVRGAGQSRSTLRNVCRAMKDRRRIEKLERSLLSKRDILHDVLQQETMQLCEAQEVKLQQILEGLSHINIATGESLKGTAIQITQRLNLADSNMRTRFAQSERTAFRRHNQAMSQAQNHREELEAKANADKFLQTLFFPEILERQSQIKGAAPGTLNWIFETEDTEVSGEDRANYLGTTQRPWDDLAAWLRNDNGVYWVNGKAGSGKSTLMAHVVDDPRTKRALDIWCGGRKCHILSYFFWRPGTDMQKNIVGLLRSLVYQICDQNPKRTQSLIKRLAIGTSKMHTWTERSLRKAFHEAIGIATWSWFCIFVDGLDEFDGNYGELVELISELEAHESVKFCVSSRPEVQLSKRLSSCRTLRLQDLNLSDIAQSTQQKLSRAGLGIYTGRELPHDYIARRADGVFLWAALVTESLVRGFEAGDDEKSLSKRIETMPQGLNDLFKSMLSKVENVHRESLAFYLHALSIDMRFEDRLISIANLTASRAPNALSSLESFGIACKQTESQVIAQSAGLIEIGESRSSYTQRFYEGSWNHADVWLRAECSTAPLKRERQTKPVQYPATLVYENRTVKWVHRSAYDFVWDHDNADVLNISQTKPEEVLRKLYRGYLTLIMSSPSCNRSMHTSHTEYRIKAPQRSMSNLWKSYTMVTREATADLHGNLENLPSDWGFWISCAHAEYGDYIFENLDILPLSTYGLIANWAFRHRGPWIWLFYEAQEESEYVSFRPHAFRIICFPSGKTPPLSDDMAFETDSFVYFETCLDTTKYLSQYFRRFFDDIGILESVDLVATMEDLETCHRMIIDDFRANEHQLEPTEKARVVECLEAHLLDMLMSIRSDPYPLYGKDVSSSPNTDVENELAVSEDWEDQTGEQDAQLSDKSRSNRVVDEEDSLDWVTDDGSSTASSQEEV